MNVSLCVFVQLFLLILLIKNFSFHSLFVVSIQKTNGISTFSRYKLKTTQYSFPVSAQEQSESSSLDVTMLPRRNLSSKYLAVLMRRSSSYKSLTICNNSTRVGFPVECTVLVKSQRLNDAGRCFWRYGRRNDNPTPKNLITTIKSQYHG